MGRHSSFLSSLLKTVLTVELDHQCEALQRKRSTFRQECVVIILEVYVHVDGHQIRLQNEVLLSAWDNIEDVI